MDYLLKLLKLVGIPTRKVIEPFLTKTLGSFLRTGLAVVGGWLLSKGIVDPDTTREFLGLSYEVIMGLAAYLIAQGFSLLEKQKRD